MNKSLQLPAGKRGRPSIPQDLVRDACLFYEGAMIAAKGMRKMMRSRRGDVDHIVDSYEDTLGKFNPDQRRALGRLLRPTARAFTMEVLRARFGTNTPSIRTIEEYRKTHRDEIRGVLRDEDMSDSRYAIMQAAFNFAIDHAVKVVVPQPRVSRD